MLYRTPPGLSVFECLNKTWLDWGAVVLKNIGDLCYLSGEQGKEKSDGVHIFSHQIPKIS